MDVEWPRPTKHELGAGYLAGAGVALIASLVGYAWLSRESVLVVGLVATTALLLFSAVVYLGYVFVAVGLSDALVWSVAKWVAVGFAVAVCVAGLVVVLDGPTRTAAALPGLVVTTVASTVLLSALLGVVSGLQRQQRELEAVSQRNSVMNRVLRHNIKNAMNVIGGHARLLAEGERGSKRAIDDAVEEILSLSEAARQIDALDAAGDGEPTDLVPIVAGCVSIARARYPTAAFAVEGPDAAWAEAGPIVRSAIGNLVENAVEHHDGPETPEVGIEVVDDSGWVAVRVADDGPGIPASILAVLSADREEATQHGEGLGLWLVRWVAEHYGGEVTFEANEARGTVVSLRLPAAAAGHT